MVTIQTRLLQWLGAGIAARERQASGRRGVLLALNGVSKVRQIARAVAKPTASATTASMANGRRGETAARLKSGSQLTAIRSDVAARWSSFTG